MPPFQEKKRAGSPNPVGRPSKYKKEYCDKLVERMAMGFSFESFAAQCDTCVDTIKEWANVHPDFSAAKRTGNAKRLEFNEDILQKLISGELTGSTTAQIFRMKNMGAGLHWKDKIESDVTMNATVTTKVVPNFGE